ncbi:hypothetical protein [Companilactobacillus hulinensis]|uniref:hypothetical protein n=1 Tax=Companilactobacillus hulinensis TaxID=2486007 RepID=UPI000F794C9C|nr:hypothetical protein [Companilactobacillus hulinensis]
MIFERNHVKHDVVHFDEITKIKVGGIKIPMHETDLFSWGVPVSPATVVYASALTRLRNPKFLLLELKDGDEVRLDMSRDFAYGSEDALDKFNQAFTILNRNLQ